METFVSDLSKKEFPISEKISASLIRKQIFDLIKRDYPTFSQKKIISFTELNLYREKYISNSLVSEIDELSSISEVMLNSLKNQSTISDKLEKDDSVTFTLGQRVADKVASFGGSWYFISSFGFFILVWILVNVLWFANKGYDPYPFILLNLILSCLAALQAPVIMMSQNRQEEKDRERAKKDYMINLKSELEIRMLHEKIDHLMLHQQQDLIEIQKIQMDMMNDILSQLKG